MMIEFANFSYGSIATYVPVTCDLTPGGCKISDRVSLFDSTVIFVIHPYGVFRAEYPYFGAFVH